MNECELANCWERILVIFGGLASEESGNNPCGFILQTPKRTAGTESKTPKVKPWVIQSFSLSDSMDRTIRWKVVEHYFTVVLFVFQFYPVWNLGKFLNFELGAVRSERVQTKSF